ncbi:MAG: tetratricopeptide repeat protein [Planctomycetota bacterium]
MNKDCSKFQSDIADYTLGRYEYIRDYEAFFRHLEECADCRNELFGMKDYIFQTQKAEGLSPEFTKRVEKIKEMARKGPYQAPPTPGPAFRDAIKQGVSLYTQGKYIEAKNIFDGLVSALSSDKNRSEDDTGTLSDVYYHLGLCYERLNNTADALSNFSRAIELSPYDADPYYHRAVIYMLMNQNQQALSDLSSAIRHNPDYTEAYFDRANIHFMAGRFQEALDDCGKGLAIEPVIPYFYVLRAMVYEITGRYKQAVEDCSAGLKEFPDDMKIRMILYSIRGRAYGLLKEYSQSISDFSRLVELTPKNASPYYYRGLVYAGSGKLDKAITDFKKALELKPGNAEITDSLIRAEQELKAKEMQERLKRKEKAIATKYAKQKDYEAEINQLKGEIKTIKELLIEIVRPRPEYSIPLPKPETDIFRMPLMDNPIRPPIIMPIPEKPSNREERR